MKAHLNLLPPSFLSQLRLRRRLSVWIGVWLVTLAICGVGFWQQREISQEKQALLVQLQAEVRPLRQLETETREFQTQSTAIRNRHSMVASLDVEQPPVRLVGLISQTAAQLDGKLIVNQLQLNRIAEVKAAPSKPSPRNPPRQQTEPKTESSPGKMEVMLQGVARDEVIVSQFVESLRASQMFLSVQLRSTLPNRSVLGTSRDYEVHCVY